MRVCVRVCVGSIMCVCVCVCVCVCLVCVCPETVSAALEFTFCSYCNHNHFTCMVVDVCICDSFHVCVKLILMFVCACVPACTLV